MAHTYKGEGSVCHYEKAESACNAICMHGWRAQKVWKQNVALTHLNSWSQLVALWWEIPGSTGHELRNRPVTCLPVWLSASCSVLPGKRSLSSLWYYHAFCAPMNWNFLELWSPCSPPSLTWPLSGMFSGNEKQNRLSTLIYIQKNPGNMHPYTPCIWCTRKPRQAANRCETELPSATQSGCIYSSRHSVSAAWSPVNSQHRTVSFAFIKNGARVMMIPHAVVMSSAGLLLTEPPRAIWMPWKRYFICKVHSLFYVWRTSS